ncbi:TetR family transcriptional regulator [Lactobacillus sp. UMNPBX7]|nr:TetR family transcriptional regulator [Limosilactobacillus reuteri]PEG80716.1 TetR family transcriptional regulator [Lactobacillus sp. UMNPBX18]PEG88402.1 TetR family transcriptional regulator [Lactobacillus sp. UMNPBX13]PEH00508.1 TetR family transcriptional regulator [Lactobacillus sp. UMNPBX7]
MSEMKNRVINFRNDNLAKLIVNCYGNGQLSVHITNNMFFERVKYSRITM